MAKQKKIDFIGILKKSIKNGSMEEWNRQAEKWREQGIKIDLSGADLSGANLRLADLSVANLHGAILHNANLIAADLRYSNLRAADLSGADLGDAEYNSATNFGGCVIDSATQLPQQNPSLEALHARQQQLPQGQSGHAARVEEKRGDNKKEERWRG